MAVETKEKKGSGVRTGSDKVKKALPQMLKGGVIMDVVNAEQAKIAEAAGAVAVMALERVPADIRAEGGVSRMSDPELVSKIIEAVSIPVMAKARIGHFVEAQILQSLGVDCIDESEVLTPADEEYHIDKSKFEIPFVCGARNLGEALRRIGEGAAMIRTKGEAGTGDVVEAVRHARKILGEIRSLTIMPREELMTYAKQIGAPFELVVKVAEEGIRVRGVTGTRPAGRGAGRLRGSRRRTSRRGRRRLRGGGRRGCRRPTEPRRGSTRTTRRAPESRSRSRRPRRTRRAGRPRSA